MSLKIHIKEGETLIRTLMKWIPTEGINLPEPQLTPTNKDNS